MSHTLSAHFVNNMNTLREQQSNQFYLNIMSLHIANWSLQEIADAFGVSKSAVANWEKKGKKLAETETDLVKNASVPYKSTEKLKSPSKETKPEPVSIPLIDQQLILKWAQEASKVSRNTPADAPSRVAASHLENMLWHYKTKGVSYSKLAAAAGVTRRAIAQRLEKRKKNDNGS